MKSINKFFIIGIIVFVGLCSFTLNTNAKDSQLDFTVTHVAGNFEKLREKIYLIFKFNKTYKVSYYRYLAEKRLAELSYVTEANNIDLVEPTASRYSTYIGVLGDYMAANKIADKDLEVTQMFERHIKILEELQGKFKFESGWWLAIQNDINNNLYFIDKFKNL